MKQVQSYHGVKRVCIQSFCGLCFLVFTPNAGKYGPEKIPNMDAFHAVVIVISCYQLLLLYVIIMSRTRFRVNLNSV